MTIKKNNKKVSQKPTLGTDEKYLLKNKLYRSKEDKIIGGVCGGISEFLGIDSIIIRIIFILLLFANGMGFILYILLWIIIPENPNQNEVKSESVKLVESEIKKTELRKKEIKENKHKSEIVIGSVLVALGLFFLFDNYFTWFDFAVLWPVVLIVIGFMLLFRKGNKRKEIKIKEKN